MKIVLTLPLSSWFVLPAFFALATEKEKLVESKSAAKVTQLSGDVEYFSQNLSNTGNRFTRIQIIDNTKHNVC